MNERFIEICNFLIVFLYLTGFTLAIRFM